MLSKLNFIYLGILLLLAVVVGLIFALGAQLGLETLEQRWAAAAVLIAVVAVATMCWQGWRFYQRRHKAVTATGSARVAKPDGPAPKAEDSLLPLRAHLANRYSWLQRRLKPWLLVTGTPELVKAHFPCLVEQQWLDTRQAVLVWAGDKSLAAGKDWRHLRGRLRKPADGIVLVSDGAMPHGNLLAALAHACGYALPVQLLLSPAVAGERAEDAAPVLVQINGKAAGKPDQISAALRQLVAPLTQNAWPALLKRRVAYFDAGLSLWLEQQHQALATWVSQLTRNLQRRQTLAGIWFAPAPAVPDDVQGMAAADEATRMALAVASGDHIVLPGLWLQNFRRQRKAKLRFSGFDWCWSILALCIGLWGAGMVNAYVQNRNLGDQAREDLATLQAAPDLKQAFPALLAVQNDMALLETRVKDGAPWFTRFGLNHNKALLAATWQPYGKAANHWLVQPVQAQLAAQLKVLNAVPMDGADSATPADGAKTNAQAGTAPQDSIGQTGYDTLKTWLMLSQPKHADAAFLAPRLAKTGMVVWPALSADGVDQVAKFYAAHLAAHPQWQLAGNDDVLFSARQTLSGLIDLKQADDTLYHQLLANTKARYPDPTMGTLLGGRDSRGLWSVQGRLPGAFTRQAYDGYVRDSIVQMSKQAVTSGDWVLGQQATQNAVKPEDLQASLTQRYFTDFGYAWQNFLNRLIWVPEANLSGTSEQLRVYADVQQSPLAALLKTIAWQAQAGAQQHSLADSLVAKARGVFTRKDTDPGADAAQAAANAVQANPLAATFGPLLRLGVVAEGNASPSAPAPASADSTLSLQRYLDRVSATRLALDQVKSATDPDAFARQLAQNLFQGKASELIDARNYAGLVAASLGSNYASMGENLFLRPLDQSWRTLMRPASASLNSLWYDSVWAPFNGATGGRFPFNDTDNEVGMGELSRFLAPQGSIAQFAKTQLGGILELQGDQWVPNPLYAQSLRFDPDFLNALNKLSRLSSRMYSEGDARYRFDLMALGHPKLTDSKLTIDGQTLDYFNQKQQWQHFAWPGVPEKAGASLTWTALQTGLQQKEDFSSGWGFVRLLAKAKVEQVDRASWRIDWLLDDGIHLRYALRTQAGEGPLELLQLKGFRLPQRVFITGREPAAGAVTASAVKPAKPINTAGR
ncbi:ImcF-related family protein [Amantichitinum ursilacus]|uniref:Intracellular multiplication and macrophage-killing n=1 Tax=Amantichitinum ursilacus TaxID=857265 RepID=A0A0N0XLK5_9NEIS|nr:ImcF-related family protein [Amantichitinum ursilacus]KPC54146.1 Intracellular multiplication and macrophage-killing [Amantichitinum ursilacus]